MKLLIQSNGVAIEVWEWMNNFIQNFNELVITYPCWGSHYSMLVKGVPDGWTEISFMAYGYVMNHW